MELIKLCPTFGTFQFEKKNLISLGTLDSLDFWYMGEGGVIRVNNNSMVVMKENKADGFYFL